MTLSKLIILMDLRFPQAVQITIGVYLYRFITRKTELGFRGVANVKFCPLAAIFCFDIDKVDVVVFFHRVKDAANADVYPILGFGHLRQVFFMACLNGVRLKVRHAFGAAGQRAAVVFYHSYDIAAKLANKKFSHV